MESTSFFTYVVWFLIALSVHTLLTIPILMELTLNKPKRTPKGKLRVKKYCFVMTHVYKGNVTKRYEYEKDLSPKNLCQLYQGLWWGSIISLSFTLTYLFFVFVAVVISIFAIPLGFLPARTALSWNHNGDYFQAYQKYGGDEEKKWTAPWKYLLPICLCVSAILWGQTFWETTVTYWYDAIFTLNTLLYWVLPIAGFIFVIVLVKVFKKTESWVATKSYLQSIKSNTCLEIELE